jgi:hypothetical protein
MRLCEQLKGSKVNEQPINERSGKITLGLSDLLKAQLTVLSAKTGLRPGEIIRTALAEHIRRIAPFYGVTQGDSDNAQE